MVRRSGLMMLAVGGLLVGAAMPAASVNPGPPQIPALLMNVQDACTHDALPAVQLTLHSETGAIVAGGHATKNGFAFKTLTPGSYQLFASAPGYENLEDRSGAPGVDVTINPGPPQVPPGDVVNQGLHLVLRLAPGIPPGPCKDPGPAQVPSVVGIVRDVATGANVAGLKVGSRSPNGQRDPGPISKSAGHFTDKALPAGDWLLHLNATGYVGLPAVQVTSGPGPIQSPPDRHGLSSSVAFGTKLGIGLAAQSAGA